MQQQKFTPKQSLPKARQYCAYQERCHTEVKEKLYGFGLNTSEVDEIISKLIEDNYLNEERFAIQYAGGHFRSKNWGRVKIKYELKKKQVSDYCIKKALSAIDDTDYYKTLQKVAGIKLKQLKPGQKAFMKMKQLKDHLRMRGFEADLVNEVVKELLN